MKFALFLLFALLGITAMLLFSNIITMILALDLRFAFGIKGGEITHFIGALLTFYLSAYAVFKIYSKMFFEREIYDKALKIHILIVLFFVIHAIIFLILFVLGLKNNTENHTMMTLAILVSIAAGVYFTRVFYEYSVRKVTKFKSMLDALEKAQNPQNSPFEQESNEDKKN